MLCELTRDESALSDAIRSDYSEDDAASSNPFVVSQSFDAASFAPPAPQAPPPPPRAAASLRLDPAKLALKSLLAKARGGYGATTTRQQADAALEAIEELEDRLVLSRAAVYEANSSVQFRSRYRAIKIKAIFSSVFV